MTIGSDRKFGFAVEHDAPIPYRPGPGAPYNAAARLYTVYSGDTSREHDLRISHIAIERLTPEEIRVRRADFDQGKIEARNVRKRAGLAGSDVTGGMSG